MIASSASRFIPPSMVLGIIYMTTFTVPQLFSKVDELYSKNLIYYQESKANFPNSNDIDMDLRVALFGIPGNVLVTYSIAVKLIETDLLNPMWWITNTIHRDKSEIDSFIQMYLSTINQGYYVHYMSRIEWIIRNILVNIKPEACNNGSGDFKGIYDCLFTEINTKELIEIFDIARMLRNTIHNNGRYINRAEKDSPIFNFRGRTIQFIHGKVIEDATTFGLELIDEVLDASHEIIYSPILKSINKLKFVIEK
jgi:hypothetical protein